MGKFYGTEDFGVEVIATGSYIDRVPSKPVRITAQAIRLTWDALIAWEDANRADALERVKVENRILALMGIERSVGKWGISITQDITEVFTVVAMEQLDDEPEADQ